MKHLKRLLFVFVLTLFSLSFVSVKAEGEKVCATVGQSYYEEGELVEENYLSAGVIHQKFIGYSSSNLEGFNAAGSGGGGLNVPGQLYPQSVNLLYIPASTNARVVNWMSTKSYGWCRSTVESCAKDYETTHPGWKVIAAINADFFDISSEKPLPETTSGACLSDGELFKSVGSTVVGFTNSGDTNTMIGEKTLQVSEKFVLSLYDSNGNVSKTYEVDNVNPTEVVDGISLYFTYPTLPAGEVGAAVKRNYVTATLPANGFVVDNPERCIPYSLSSFYGVGATNKTTEALELITQKFGVYASDDSIKEEIENASKISIQKRVIGDYAACESITGCGDTLVRNGKGVVYDNKTRHPRTMVGVQADGTLVFCTVDGRQPTTMYGMTSDEQGALMEAYGCVQAYNLDGGGSTTILIRDGNKFRVLNSPSDGSARLDANSLLVVVPELSLKVSDVTDTSLTITCPDEIVGVTVENIKVSINGGSLQDITSTMTIENLTPTSVCTINYEYDRTYKGETVHVHADEIKVKMGKTIPTLKTFTYTKNETGETVVKYEFNDPNNSIETIKLYYTGGSKTLKLENNEIVLPKKEYKQEDFSIVLFFNLESETTYSATVEYDGIQYIEDAPIEPIINPEVEPEAPTKKGCRSGAYYFTILPMMLAAAFILIKKH